MTTDNDRTSASSPHLEADPAPAPVQPSQTGNLSRRTCLGRGCLGVGLALQRAVEIWATADRPALKRPLAEAIPLTLGTWIGRDLPVDPEVLRAAQCDDHLNRNYVDRKNPNQQVSVWISYSQHGLNMRHSPEVCLPSSGWQRVESACRTTTLSRSNQPPLTLSELAYAKGEQSQWVGFWYYIFGETALQRAARQLPLTSQSSHARATSGSGLTVELFGPRIGSQPPEAIEQFALDLLSALEPVLPTNRVQYEHP